MARKKSSNRNKDDLLDLSEWMASDTDFFVIRRFETLNARVILKLQTEICDLEARLSYLDRISEYHGEGTRPRSFLGDTEERRELLDDLDKKLDHYNNYILTYSQIQARTKANSKQVNNIRQWVRLYSDISPFETNFAVEKDSDLIAINEDRTTPFRTAVGKLAEAYTRAEEEITGVGLRAHIYPETFYQRFETWAVILGGIAMLVAPLWWLLYTHSPKAQLGIITGFMLAAAFFIWTITNASPSELLGAVTAYTGVLMVFQVNNGA